MKKASYRSVSTVWYHLFLDTRTQPNSVHIEKNWKRACYAGHSGYLWGVESGTQKYFNCNWIEFFFTMRTYSYATYRVKTLSWTHLQCSRNLNLFLLVVMWPIPVSPALWLTPLSLSLKEVAPEAYLIQKQGHQHYHWGMEVPSGSANVPMAVNLLTASDNLKNTKLSSC